MRARKYAPVRAQLNEGGGCENEGGGYESKGGGCESGGGESGSKAHHHSSNEATSAGSSVESSRDTASYLRWGDVGIGANCKAA